MDLHDFYPNCLIKASIMEKKEDWRRTSVAVNELKAGMDLALQLQNQIHFNESSSSSMEACDLLLQNILDSYDKVISLLSLKGSSEVMPSMNNPARTVVSRQETDEARRRRSVPRRRERVPVDVHDGFSWRKYGQKVILGAKHPRDYYRCALKKVRGCSATKRVQKSDSDPSFVEVTYFGNHTCDQVSEDHICIHPTGRNSNEPMGDGEEFEAVENVISQDLMELHVQYLSSCAEVQNGRDFGEEEFFSPVDLFVTESLYME